MTRNTNPTAETVQLVWDRDGGCAKCGTGLYGVRGVQWHLHHRRPRSMGGSREPWVNLPGNLVALCAPCHRDVESNRERARDDGFLVSANGVQLPVNVAIQHFAYGRVLLDDFGKWTHQEVPF